MKDTVLITGCAGMIGSHVAERVLRNHNVVGLDDLSGGVTANVPSGVNLYQGSCLNTALLDNICRHESPRFIIHCAAMAAENLSHNCRVFTYQNNLTGEANVRNAAVRHGAECMASMSSIAVMGHQQPPFTETDEPRPTDPYGISKLAGEMDAKVAHEFFGLNYLIFRPHNVIGTRQNLADRYRNVAAIFIRAIVEKKPLPIFGDGLQTRAFSPVSHVAEIIAEAMERRECWNQVYNVGSDQAVSILDLKRMLETITGEELPVEHHEQRKEAVHAHMSHSKIGRVFWDITQKETAEEVLRDMWYEAMQQPTLPEYQQGPEIELQKNLPPAWRNRP
jgi:UDP-glucose 4-epimerase